MADINQIHIFDRALLKHRRNRAAPRFDMHRVLFDEAGDGLMERIADIKRPFPRILDLGAHDGALTTRLKAKDRELVVAADLAQAMINHYSGNAVVADEELLPFASASFDLVISNLSLHHVNDLPGTLAQIRHILRPGGLFLATMLGGHTLYELRRSLMESELAVTSGVSPRVSPTIDLPTATALLQRAGFALPVTDQENITLTYDDMIALLHDIRGMGETNIQRQRLRHFTKRQIMARAAELYQAHHAAEGVITATFDIIYLHGWKNETI